MNDSATTHNVTYIVSDKYMLIRIKRKNVLKTKIRGFSEKVNSVLGELDEDNRSLGAIAVGLALYRSRSPERYLDIVRKAFFDPNLSRLLFEVAVYYVNMHSAIRNLNSKLATLTRHMLTVLVNSKTGDTGH